MVSWRCLGWSCCYAKTQSKRRALPNVIQGRIEPWPRSGNLSAESPQCIANELVKEAADKMAFPV
jgi:hypothetical protein